MAFYDKLAAFSDGTSADLDLSGLDTPAISAKLSDSIDATVFQLGAEPIYLVVTVTATLVAAAGTPAYCFALTASTATDASSVLAGYDVWRFGNVDFTAFSGINVLGKGVLGSAMVAGTTLFTVPIGVSPLLIQSYRYLTFSVQQVAANASTTSGRVSAYLTSTPPSGKIVYPDAI